MKAKHARAIRRGILSARIVQTGAHIKLTLGTLHADPAELFDFINKAAPPKHAWLTYRAYWRVFGVRL